MKLSIATLATVSGLVSIAATSAVHAQQSNSFTGEVQRVWEDGLSLDTGDRSLRVDTWDLYGDSTHRYVTVGNQVTITGEFDGREFDAFSITDSNGEPLSVSVNPNTAEAADTGFTGIVERVWEDGFRFNTGNRIFTVDSWQVCGDFTASHVSVGDRLTLTGEFERQEFDVFSITNGDGASVCG
jgi:hypothetical protein